MSSFTNGYIGCGVIIDVGDINFLSEFASPSRTHVAFATTFRLSVFPSKIDDVDLQFGHRQRHKGYLVHDERVHPIGLVFCQAYV